jgi:hypothetical protein
MTIKTRTYNGKLYRANETSFIPGSKASNNYKNAPMKYFTLNKSELKTYIPRGRPYVKNWKTTAPLELVDILDLSTRRALESTPGLKGALKIAFPVEKNLVLRVSTELTKNQDDIVLGKLCELGYDGYYMETIGGFHSEVGLCPKALHKLELEKSKRNTNTGIEGPTKKKRRPSNNNNNGTLRQPRFALNMNNNNGTRRRPRFTLNNNNNSVIKGSLF